MARPLSLAFVWHMHQPFYKDPITGEISLPWVRLHGIKDYHTMVAILEGFPAIRQTFNLVPSLIDQIEAYTAGRLPNEKFLHCSLLPATDLNLPDKKFILLNFFMAHWEYMILPFPRYHELLRKRGKFTHAALLDRVLARFTTQDYLDLQVLFNLSWFDPHFRQNDTTLKGLTKKGSRFTEEDKRLIIDKQIEVLKKIIPTYKRAQDRGQIEVSISPYYHPILPLLCDTDTARICMPGAALAKRRFSHPEDAAWHVGHAVKRYEEIFGKKARGMWPSEGSVSEEILPILIEHGIRWIATDEGILLRSLHAPRTADVIYRPYLLKRDKGKVHILFRDFNLSDLIGFTYQKAPAKRAVDEFIAHLHRIRGALSARAGNFLVPIILDGENAWEYYPNNGRDFLTLLYARLSEDPLLKTTTVSDFLSEHPPEKEIARLHPGSWINADFSTWIGQEEKNTSWNYLATAREDLARFQKDHPELAGSKKLEDAWRELYIAEGSDWNWWYGPQNSSAYDEEFDRLYRKHLANIYEITEQPLHDMLKMPIITKVVKPIRGARGLIKPVIDGLDTTYYEWLEAASFDVAFGGGTMHRTQSIIQRICCGFSLTTLYIKMVVKFSEMDDIEKEQVTFVISKLPPHEARLELPLFQNTQSLKGHLYRRDAPSEDWKLVTEIANVAYRKIVEIAVPFADLDIKEGEEFKLAFFIEENGLTLEQKPESGPITLVCPTGDYEAQHWTT